MSRKTVVTVPRSSTSIGRWDKSCHLKERGLDDNTVVIFTSDNGSRAQGEGGSNGPLRGHKAETWEGGQRLPCIVRWPGQIDAGQTCAKSRHRSTFCQLSSVLLVVPCPATALLMVKMCGRCGLMRATSPHEAFYYMHMGSFRAVRQGNWKLHVSRQRWMNCEDEITAGPELYNLADDLAETTNVADQHPEVVAQLQALIDAKRQELGDRNLGITGSGVRPIGYVKTMIASLTMAIITQ